MSSTSVVVRELGLCEYETTLVSMQAFTNGRKKDTQDEIWLLQHPPVFTRGVSCRQLPNRLLPSTMKVVDSDRGGQMTYHGPGQLMVYFIFNVRKLGWGPKTLINNLEQLIIDVLAQFKIAGKREQGKPGVYVDGKKIASIGLKIKRGYSYHGLSLNIDMDLGPFKRINTCGYEELEVTQMKNYCNVSLNEVKKVIKKYIKNDLSSKAT